MPATLTLGGDLEVLRMGFGTMRLEPGAGALEVLRSAPAAGVQLLDTADVYGSGEIERLVAEALHPYPDGLVVATKGGLVREGRLTLRPVGRPDHLRRACEASLRRLRLERIDLYQLHSLDGTVPLEESVGALAELRDEGKIRHVGLCNVGPRELAAARAIVPIASVQNRYNLVERGSEPTLAACDGAGIAFIPWFPLAKGALAGGGRAVARLAHANGATPAQVALAWLLSRSAAVLPIPGTASAAHLEENVAALELALGEAELAGLDGYRLPAYEARLAAKTAARAAFRALRSAARATRRGRA